MFDKSLNFNLVSPHDIEKTKSNARLLKRYGFEVLYLREADIIQDCDNSIIGEVYVLCCRGSLSDYIKFKRKFDMEEILYEGDKTLIG